MRTTELLARDLVGALEVAMEVEVVVLLQVDARLAESTM